LGLRGSGRVSAANLRAVIVASPDTPASGPASRSVSDPAGRLYRVVQPLAAWSRAWGAISSRCSAI